MPGVIMVHVKVTVSSTLGGHRGVSPLTGGKGGLCPQGKGPKGPLGVMG